jgi:methyl-accepting chemotaxis protein
MKVNRFSLFIGRVMLAGVLVASLVPLANLTGGVSLFTTAWAEDAASPPAAADAGDANGAGAAGGEGAEGDTAGTAPGSAAGSASGTAPTSASGTASASSGSASSAAATSGKPADVKEKEEVVYGMLDGAGAPHSGYVVNHFQIDGAGTLVDRGDYRSATNLSTTAALDLSGSKVSGAVEKGDFYYEGVLGSVVLPWRVEVSYVLDGQPVKADELAGASGRLEVHIKTWQNPTVDPVFFENYLLQVQLTLDTERVKGISAPSATVASAGKNKQVAFMVMPGKEGDLTLRAQVTDFEMPGIQISGLPFSMVFDVPDTSSVVDDMTKLSEAIGELSEGVGELQDGVLDMKEGAAGLASGSASLNEGLSLLSSNSAGLTDASAQIDGALAEITAQLEAGAVDPALIGQLVSGLQQLAAGLSSGDPSQPGLAEGLAQLQGGISSATAAMDAQVSALVPVDAGAIEGLASDPGLGSLLPESQGTVNALINTNTQAAYVRGTWEGGVKAGLDGVVAGLDQSIGSCQYMAGQISTIAGGLEQGLGGLAGLPVLTEYLKQLSGNYSAFNKGLATYTEGIDTIAVSYSAFNKGLAQFAGGVSDLYGGISTLYSGTRELYTNVEDLPQTVQDEIDSFLEDYQKSDFVPTSFLSADNEHVERVQFILLTDPIKPPSPEEDKPADEPAAQGFWSRLTALFGA